MLEIRVLGTAAGGGLPQWNCACENCRLARAGRLPARLQSAFAVAAGGGPWHLVNASPDVARQLEMLPRRADPAAARGRPFGRIFLTNADLDHALGLLQLREGERLAVTAPAAVRRSLGDGLDWTRLLACYGGVEWAEPALGWSAVDDFGLEVRMIPLVGAGPPRHDRAASAAGPHAVGYLFRAGGRTAGFFPDVPGLDGELTAALAGCERVWFDGTFWSEEEMRPLTGRTASAMGHVPIESSLPVLAAGGPGRVAYAHLNNTNPALRPDSAERHAIERAGLRIAEDGEQVVLGGD